MTSGLIYKATENWNWLSDLQTSSSPVRPCWDRQDIHSFFLFFFPCRAVCSIHPFLKLGLVNYSQSIFWYFVENLLTPPTAINKSNALTKKQKNLKNEETPVSEAVASFYMLSHPNHCHLIWLDRIPVRLPSNPNPTVHPFQYVHGS